MFFSSFRRLDTLAPCVAQEGIISTILYQHLCHFFPVRYFRSLSKGANMEIKKIIHRVGPLKCSMGITVGPI